jgi:hypothetical protein
MSRRRCLAAMDKDGHTLPICERLPSHSVGSSVRMMFTYKYVSLPPFFLILMWVQVSIVSRERDDEGQLEVMLEKGWRKGRRGATGSRGGEGRRRSCLPQVHDCRLASIYCVQSGCTLSSV